MKCYKSPNQDLNNHGKFMTIEQDFSDFIKNNEQNNNLMKNDLLNLLTDTIKQIRGQQTEKGILQTSVDIVHQILECDRVVVYSLLSESQGKIIAEALTPGFPPTIGSVIKDPCFEARFIEQYQRGRVRATPNIFEAGMSSCYIDNLEKIGVKANLVIPLINGDGSLFGLLVLHQCSEFRQWQQSEINFGIQVAGLTMEQVEKAKECHQLQVKLTQITQWQDSLAKVTHEFHDATKQSEVLQIAVDRVKEFLNSDRVVVYSLEAQDLGKIVAESSLPALAPLLGSVIKDPCFEYRYKDKYQQGRVRAIDNIYQAGMTACYIENLEKIAVKANLVAPINLPNGELYGLLVVHQCFAFREWQTKEIEWLKEIGIQMGANLLRTDLAAKMKSLETSFTKLDASKNLITVAKDKIGQIDKSMQNTMMIFSDINNLQNLCFREINSISNRKETKVMQIIVKKIALNIEKVKNSLSLFQADTNQVEELLKDLATNLDGTESEEIISNQ